MLPRSYRSSGRVAGTAGILGGVSRFQRHNDGLEVDIHPGREEFAARVVAEREALVGKALHLLSLYLHHDRLGFWLDTITVPTAGEAELSFSWSSAKRMVAWIRPIWLPQSKRVPSKW